MFNKFITRYYNFVNIKPAIDASKLKFINLFKSSCYNNTENFDNELEKNDDLKNTYEALLPFIIENENLAYKPIKYVLNMEFNSDNNLIKIHYLGRRGIIEKLINVEDIKPVTDSDLYNSLRFKRVQEEEVVDLDMVYLNSIDKEYLLFLKNGEWDNKNIGHQNLSLTKLYKEIEWLDYNEI